MGGRVRQTAPEGKRPLEAFDRLRQELARRYPQLAEAGLNDGDAFQRQVTAPPPRRTARAKG